MAMVLVVMLHVPLVILVLVAVAGDAVASFGRTSLEKLRQNRLLVAIIRLRHSLTLDATRIELLLEANFFVVSAASMSLNRVSSRRLPALSSVSPALLASLR